MLPSLDRTLAWILAPFCGFAATVGALAFVVGLLHNDGGEGIVIVMIVGCATFVFAAPAAVGSVFLLGGRRAGYWGWIASGVVTVLGTVLATRGTVLPIIFLSLLAAVGPTSLAVRRLAELSATLGHPGGSPAPYASPARSSGAALGITRAVGGGGVLLGGVVAIRATTILLSRGIGPPVSEDAGDRLRALVYGGPLGIFVGGAMIAGGIAALLGARWGLFLALMAFFLAIAPYALFAGFPRLIAFVVAGWLTTRTLERATRP